MSVTGKNAKSIRKQEFKESRNLAQGFQKLTFAHKASLGDTVINLGSLTTPTEMSALGFTNPSSSRLTEAKLFQFKKNLTLVSSLRGTLMQDLSYRVNSNSSIKLEFTAEEGEIFTGVIDANPASGIKVVDAKVQKAVGDLADGETDFPIGFATSTLREEIVVFRNGLIQKRNSNNSSTLLDGNYYLVDTGSGFGSVVRFNSAASGGPDSIIVTSLGNIIESPTDSSWAEIEKVQGQIDAMVPTLAALAGVSVTDFQATPNDVDLKAFGDVVQQILNISVIQEYNTFGARIANNGAASITSQSGGFIQSVNRPSIGLIDVTFTPGFFTVAPSVVASKDETAAGNTNSVQVENVSTSGCTLRMRETSTGAFNDYNVSIVVNRQGSDVKVAKTIKGILGL